MQRIAIIPAYEPPDAFLEYAALLADAVDRLIVVNDGSGSGFGPIFAEIAKLPHATVLSYPENHGKGYALKTAFSYCAEHFAGEDILVTADCDGQHRIEDVLAVCKAAESYPDTCVLGCRDFTQENVPARSRTGNTNMLRLLRLMYGIRISDSQTGLRGFTVETAKQFLHIKGDRFEYETGMLIYAKRHHIPFREVSIQTIYSEKGDTHISHFRTFRDSMRVVGTLLRYLGGNLFSGLSSIAADIAVFSLCTYVLFPEITPYYTILATVIGRIASSVVNFIINNKYIFHGKAKRSLFRYYVVWLSQLLASYFFVYLFGHVLGGHLSLVKVIVELCLALVSYQMQCNWVYEPPQKRIYGRYGKFVRWLFRTFSRKYRCDFALPEAPVVFVCRHLDMHGPYTTMKWLPTELHPMIIHMYFDRKATVKHMTEYTFAERYGKKVRKINLAAHVMSWITPPLMKSLRAVPVYRNGPKSVNTIKQGLKYLMKNESLIVYPDVQYMDGYDKPSKIYEGFAYIGELYYKKTGKQLSFVPLLIDDKNRRITAGESISLRSYREEIDAVAKHLQEQINWNEIPACV